MVGNAWFWQVGAIAEMTASARDEAMLARPILAFAAVSQTGNVLHTIAMLMHDG